MDKILPAIITYIYHHTLLRITILFTLLFGLAGEGWGQITLHSITPEERCGAGSESVTATFSSTINGNRTYYAEYLSGTTWTPFASVKFLTPTNETLTGTINLPVDSYNIRIRHTSGNTVYESNYLVYTVTASSIGGTATATDPTICSGSSTTITLAGYTGLIQWQQSADGSTGWANVTGGSGETTENYTTPNLSETTYFRAEVTNENCDPDDSNVVTVTVNHFNMVVSDSTLTPSEEHCPEFGGPFNPDNSDYNPGVTEVIFKVEKNLSTTNNWTFDFAIDGTDVEVYELVSVTDNNDNTIFYSGDKAGGNLDAGDNTVVTFTFWILNVPGTALNVKFTVSGGDDGDCSETGSTDDNSRTHVINVMPVLGSFTP